MRTRFFPCLALLGLLALPGLSQAAGAPTPTAKTSAPGFVLQLKSIDGLVDDFNFLAKAVGKEEEAKQLAGMVKGFAGDDVLKAFDRKRPLGLYGHFGKTAADTTAVGLVPISDEDAVLDLFGRFGMKPEKGEDDIYTVTPPNGKTGYFRFAKGYAYVCDKKEALEDKDQLLNPATVLPARETAPMLLTVHLDSIPKAVRDDFLTQVDRGLEQARQLKDPKETEAQTRLKEEMLDHTNRLLHALVRDGRALEARLDINHKAEEVGVEVSLGAENGSKLATLLADVGAEPTLFSGLVNKETAFSMLAHMSLPDDLRKPMAAVLDEAVQKGLEQQSDKTKREEGARAWEILAPSLKAGELDTGMALRGPSADGLYTFVGGLKVKDGEKIDKLFRDLVEHAPAADRKKITFDAARVGEVSLHRLDLSKDLEPDARKAFGANPECYVAFRSDALLFAVGDEAMKAMKEAIALKPQAGKVFSFRMAPHLLAPAMEKENPGAVRVAEEVFPKGEGEDNFELSVEGGKTLRMRMSMKTQTMKFFTRLSEEKAAAGAKSGQ